MLSKKPLTRKVFSVSICLSVCLLVSGFVQGQDNDQIRRRALELYEAQNFVLAIPVLEQAAAAYPKDAVILSRLGFSLYAVSTTQESADVRKKTRQRAREVLKKSQSLGDNSNLTMITLDALKNEIDEAAISFSRIQAADAAIRDGEAAFVKGDFDKAIKAYKRALELDPKLYDAALYAGDCEFKKASHSQDEKFRNEHFDEAGVWFAKAITIDPNRETAYRYWGDALDSQGKSAAARDKFVDAIVAEPYMKRSYVGLTQWAERHRVPIGHPKIEIPAGFSAANGESKITLDPAAMERKDGSTAWLMYGIGRAGWTNKNNALSEKFAKAYPNEHAYRHSLAEEVDALKLVVESALVQMKDKSVSDLNASLTNLIRLKDAGLLEAYVLFARADNGIARDYDSYRAANREKLRRYWLELVIPKSEARGSTPRAVSDSLGFSTTNLKAKSVRTYGIGLRGTFSSRIAAL